MVCARSALALNENEDIVHRVYFHPAVRWGTNDRVLYVMDFLVPLYRGDKSIVFSNIKFTPDNNDGWETNLGLGYRHMVIDDGLILGTNLFYDHRRTEWGSHFDQFGVGIEAMAEINGLGLTGRANYYYPLPEEETGTGGGYAFYGNGIHYAGFEETMMGFDYEAGFRIPYISDYAESWFYAGGYHFFGNHVSDVNGFSTRFEIIPTDFVRLNLEYRHDNVNESEFYTEVALEVPFSIENLVAGENPFEGFGSRLSRSRELPERMTEPVRRDVDIFTGTGPQNPAGEIDYGSLVSEVVFVSEGGEAGSPDGTFENPWPSIAAAMADPRLGDTAFTIHVLNDNTGDLVAGGGTVDVGDLLIWGSGVDHPGLGSIINMPPGYPALNSALTLNAENLFVTGLGFDMGHGFTDNFGIDIQNGTGITIWDNYIDLSIADTAYGVYSSIGTDIGSAAKPLLIGKNTISVESTGDGADAYGIYLNSSGDIFTKIINNDMLGTILGASDAYGIYLDSGGTIGSEMSPMIINNNLMMVKATNDGASGIRLEADDSIFTSIKDNDLSDTIGRFAWGIVVYVDDGDIGSESMPVLITGNSIKVTAAGSEGHAFGIIMVSDSMSSSRNLFARITDNDLSNTIWGGMDARGIYLYSFYGGIGSERAPVLVKNNPMTVTSSTGTADGIDIVSSGDLFARITDNDMSNTIWGGKYAHGIVLSSFSGGIGSESAPVLVKNNPMTVTGSMYIANGVYVHSSDDLFVRIIDNDMSNYIWGGYGAYGIYLDSTSGDIGSDGAPVLVSNNPMTVMGSTNEAYGIYMKSSDDLFTRIQRNSIYITAGTDAWGAYLQANLLIGNAATPTLFLNNSGTITGNNRYMLRLDDSGAAGSNIDWGGNSTTPTGTENSFTTGGGNWSGDYPGANGPVDTINYGGTITP